MGTKAPVLSVPDLGHFALFADLTQNALEDVAGAARPRDVRRGGSAFEQGQPALIIYLVLGGRFKALQVGPEGNQIVTRLAGAGDLMGHISAFKEAPYPVTATAVLDSTLFGWERRVFVRLLNEHPALSLALIRYMGQSIEDAHSRLLQAAGEHVERRIAHAVLRLVRQAGRKIDGGIEIAFPVTRQDIGLMSGTTLHTVSRVLSAWEQSGIVDGGRQHLILRDPHAIVVIAGEQ